MFGIMTDHNQQRKIINYSIINVTTSVLLMAFLTVATRIYFVGTEEKFDIGRIVMVVNVIIVYCALEMVVDFFCLSAYGIWLRLKMLSEVLINNFEYLFDLKLLKNLENSHKKAQKCHLMEIPKLYMKIYEINKNLNWVLGLPICMFSFFVLLSLTFGCFELYLLIFYERTSTQVQYCVLSNIWSFFTTYHFSLIC